MSRMGEVSKIWQTPALWNTNCNSFSSLWASFITNIFWKAFMQWAISPPDTYLLIHQVTLQWRPRVDNGDNIFLPQWLLVPSFWQDSATINTPCSHHCGSQTLLWAKMRPSVASGLSCQRSTGISKSQSLYCSPGYNGHMGLWPLSRSPLWTSEMVTKVWHTCDCGLNSFFSLVPVFSEIHGCSLWLCPPHQTKNLLVMSSLVGLVIWLQWDITIIYYNYTLFYTFCWHL